MVHNRAPLRQPWPKTLNATFSALGLLDWKPTLTALLLPPVPLLLMLLMAWWWRNTRALLAAFMLIASLLGLWFSQCEVTGALLERRLATAPVLTPERLADLRRSWPARHAVVLVLGSGVRSLASEYGEAHLRSRSMARLHYGLWLGRQLQTPVMFSGGAGHAQPNGPREAEVAARIASRDYGVKLQWLETESRDTRENARWSVQLLRREGITDVLLVTHDWHMLRARRNFEEEAARAGLALRIEPAPMGIANDDASLPVLRWLPSAEGNQRVRQSLREWAGWLAGA